LKYNIMTYDWPTLLYPAEWCFRFFITGVIIFIVFGLSTTLSLVAYWTMVAAAAGAFIIQVRILFMVATGRISESE